MVAGEERAGLASDPHGRSCLLAVLAPVVKPALTRVTGRVRSY